jgi:hypothetical protein
MTSLLHATYADNKHSSSPTAHRVQVSNKAITNLYPPDDNYELHPTDPSKRCPKLLTDLCIDAICRSLPDLDGQLPAGLPQDVVEHIIQSLTSHAALNCTTLGALANCELVALSLANVRGVSDEWLVTLTSSLSTDIPHRNSVSASNCNDTNQRRRFACNHGSGSIPITPSLRGNHPIQFVVPGSAASTMMDIVDVSYSCDNSRLKDNVEDCCINSYGSCSTSSFVSASSRSTSPFLPSAQSKSFPLTLNPPAPSASLWLHPTSGSTSSDIKSDACMRMHLSLQKPYHLPNATHDSIYFESSKCRGSFLAPSSTAGGMTSTLTLLDLRGSQRVTDRGLLQLSRAPLFSLEVARLDNCYGITGRGLLAFSRSHRLHTLSMSNCRRLTDEAVVNVSCLGSSLTTLNFGGCRCLTDRSLEAVGGLAMLRTLDLSQVRLE